MPTRPFAKLKSIVSNTGNQPSSRTVRSTTTSMIPCCLSVCGQARHSSRESESAGNDEALSLLSPLYAFNAHHTLIRLTDSAAAISAGPLPILAHLTHRFDWHGRLAAPIGTALLWKNFLIGTIGNSRARRCSVVRLTASISSYAPRRRCERYLTGFHRLHGAPMLPAVDVMSASAGGP